MFTLIFCHLVFFFKQKTAYEMRISDWSSDVCSSDLSHRACSQRDHGKMRRFSVPNLFLLVGRISPNSQWRGRRCDQHRETPMPSASPKCVAPARYPFRIRDRDRRSAGPPERSEERRVGKGVASTVSRGGRPIHKKKKETSQRTLETTQQTKK